MSKRTWQEAVALAEHYLAIYGGEPGEHPWVYLDNDTPGGRPWEFVTEVRAGGWHCFGLGPLEVSFTAIHPCGIKFGWSQEIYYDMEHNKMPDLRVQVDTLASIRSALPAAMVTQLDAFLAERLKEIEEHRDKTADSLRKMTQAIFGLSVLLKKS